MYTLLRQLTLRKIALEQLPVLAASFLTAEMFYHFRSFSLECLAFLGTWYLFDRVLQWTKALRS